MRTLTEEKLAKRYLDIAGVIIVAIDKKGNVTLLNKRGCQILGYKEGELVGKNWFDICIPEDQREQVKKVFKEIVSGKIKKLDRYENFVVTKKGKIRLISWHNTIIKNGEISGTLSSGEDITEKREAEEKMKESELKYRRLFEAAQDAILILNAYTGEIQDSNPYIEKLLGYSKKELVGKQIWQISPFKNIIANKEKFTELQKKKFVHYEDLPLETKKGEKAHVEFVSNVYGINGDTVIQCNIRDITDRYEAEKKLKNSEAQLHATLDSTNDGILAIGRNGEVLNANRRFVELWHIPQKLIAKKDDKILLDYVLSQLSEPEAFLKKVKELYGSKKVDFDTIHFKDGRIFERYSSPLIIEDENAGRVWSFSDVTERTKLDQAKTDFLSLASHQLRTPLSATKWVLEVLLEDQNLTPKQRQKFIDLFSSNERLITLVNDLLGVARIETGKLVINKVPTDLEKLIRELIDSLKNIASKKNKIIKIDLPAGLKKVNCDPVLLHESLENLLVNAINYSTEDSREINLVISEREDDYIVSVHNEGLIESQICSPDIFDKKFVRGEVAQERKTTGSGLGLYITKRLVEACDGKIWYESSAEAGTTFFLTIIKSKGPIKK